jgi:hypothetical protein
VPSTPGSMATMHPWSMAPMAQPAILVLLGVKPWSEDIEGKDMWTWWRENTQQEHLPDGLAWCDTWQWEQQDEWVTATGGRCGVNALLKPLEALLAPQGPQPSASGVVRMVVRPATTTRQGHVIQLNSRRFACLWPGNCVITNPVSRTDQERSSPNTLEGVIPDPTVRAALFQALRAAVDKESEALAQLSTATRTQRQHYNDRNRMATMSRLLREAFMPRPEPECAANIWSTKWAPLASRRIQGPSDLLVANCCCARLLKFPDWLHLSCDCGPLVPNRSTQFGPASVIPSILHFMKFEMLSKCKASVDPPRGGFFRPARHHPGGLCC